MTSTRLPGKVLLPVKGRALIHRVIDRVLAAAMPEDVVVAIPDTETQIPLLVELVSRVEHVSVVRGPEQDVLRRYAIAAEWTGAETIVRVTSDCPYVDPRLIDLAVVMRRDYNLPFLDARAFHGSEVEVFTREALMDADAHAVDPADREHVGPYMRRKYPVNMCVDTPEDYERLR